MRNGAFLALPPPRPRKDGKTHATPAKTQPRCCTKVCQIPPDFDRCRRISARLRPNLDELDRIEPHLENVGLHAETAHSPRSSGTTAGPRVSQRMSPELHAYSSKVMLVSTSTASISVVSRRRSSMFMSTVPPLVTICLRLNVFSFSRGGSKAALRSAKGSRASGRGSLERMLRLGATQGQRSTHRVRAGGGGGST